MTQRDKKVQKIRVYRQRRVFRMRRDLDLLSSMTALPSFFRRPYQLGEGTRAVACSGRRKGSTLSGKKGHQREENRGSGNGDRVCAVAGPLDVAEQSSWRATSFSPRVHVYIRVGRSGRPVVQKNRGDPVIKGRETVVTHPKTVAKKGEERKSVGSKSTAIVTAIVGSSNCRDRRGAKKVPSSPSLNPSDPT